MSNSKYAGEFEIVLEKKNDKTVISEKRFDGLIKLSPTIHLDSEKISTYFIVGLGGGYVEGEKYKYSINLKEDARSIITTQASTKVYKCIHGEKTEQETLISLEKNSILEYITDSVILYKDAIYKQVNNIYMDESATLIYSDGITSGWSKEGEEFQYSNVQLKTKVYVNNKIVLLDNLLVNPRKDDVTKLGFFEGYENFGTLLVINKNINVEILEDLRNNINNLVSSIYKEIKSRKPYVKWTISPAGIWRNKNKLSEYKGSEYGSDTKSYNPNFDALHADVLLWMLNGEKTDSLTNATEKDGINKMYVDAIIPQVYWSSKHRLVPFDITVNWWINEAKKSTNGNLADLYIGHALYRMGSSTNIEPWQDIDLLSKQIDYIRKEGKGFIKGSSFFTMHNMYKNDRDTGDFGNEAIKYIKENNYIFKAIVPEMNTMKDLKENILKPENPKMKKYFNYIEISFTDPNEYKLDDYSHPKIGTSVYYAIYRKIVNSYEIELIDKIRRTNFNENARVIYKDKTANRKSNYIYYITALDRIHNESDYLEIGLQ